MNIHFLRGQTVYFLALKRALGFKVVLSAHGSDILKPPESCSRYLPYFCRFADAVTVVSENLAVTVRGYPRMDPAKIRVIPNGIDYEFWSSCPPRALEADDPAPTIVAAGRLEQVKGFDVLIRAFACLRTIFPDARLVIAGEGPLHSELEDQAASLGLGGTVELPGRLDRSALRNLFCNASAFALSSWSEGMPLALLEAMASGLPVVATRVGGVPEVLTPGAGLMASPGDSAAITDALARILRDKTLAQGLGQAGRKRASEFSAANSDQAYEDLYLALLGQ